MIRWLLALTLSTTSVSHAEVSNSVVSPEKVAQLAVDKLVSWKTAEDVLKEAKENLNPGEFEAVTKLFKGLDPKTLIPKAIAKGNQISFEGYIKPITRFNSDGTYVVNGNAIKPGTIDLEKYLKSLNEKPLALHSPWLDLIVRPFLGQESDAQVSYPTEQSSLSSSAWLLGGIVGIAAAMAVSTYLRDQKHIWCDSKSQFKFRNQRLLFIMSNRNYSQLIGGSGKVSDPKIKCSDEAAGRLEAWAKCDPTLRYVLDPKREPYEKECTPDQLAIYNGSRIISGPSSADTAR